MQPTRTISIRDITRGIVDYMETMNFDTPFTIPLAHVEKLCNPALDDAWGCGVITKEDVLACKNPEFGSKHASTSDSPDEMMDSWDYNVARIHHLMHNDWDDRFPITLDVGVFGYAPYPILDGNHRVAAAIFRGDETITIEAMGDVEVIEKLLVLGLDSEEES